MVRKFNWNKGSKGFGVIHISGKKKFVALVTLISFKNYVTNNELKALAMFHNFGFFLKLLNKTSEKVSKNRHCDELQITVSKCQQKC